MPRRQFHTNRKNKKVPETADDFLDAGVEYEESGDRWRPGDKAKAGRFYVRAIDSYQASLVRNPRSFDAAYNKARLQYYISQEPELLPPEHQSRNGVTSLLGTALQSHRDCLSLDPENEDALFNTGQVLSSLAEVLVDDRNASTESKLAAIAHLDESITIFQKCLSTQEAQYDAFEASRSADSMPVELPTNMHEVDMDTDEQGGVAVPASPSSETASSEGHQYAVVQTPVTLSQILDTALAQLNAFTISLSLLTHDVKALERASAAAEQLRSEKLWLLASKLPDQAEEVSLANASYLIASAEAFYKAGLRNLATWENDLGAIFVVEGSSWDWENSARALCDKAEAHSAIALAAAESSYLDTAWRQYAVAAQCLASAAKLDRKKAEIYLLRGDTEMLRSRLQVEAAVKSRDLLRKNAGVFYRGAATLDPGGKAGYEGKVKEWMLNNEEQNSRPTWSDVGTKIAREAVEEGIFGREWMSRIAW